MRLHKRVGTVIVNGMLLLVLVGLLAAYLMIVNDLPARVYTEVQQEYLAYNSRRSLSQVAPSWHVVLPGSDTVSTYLPGQDSRVRAKLKARYEEQDGVSATVYDLDFAAEYHLRHTGPMSTTVELFFPFPGNLETLHGVLLLVDGSEPPKAGYTTQGIGWQTVLAPGDERQIEIRYQADGANSFAYSLQHDLRTDIDVAVTVEGLVGSQIPRHALPASASDTTDGDEVWTWHYTGLIADRDILLGLPTRLSFAQRVAQLQSGFRALAGLSPLLVGLFLGSLAGVLYLSGVRLRLAVYLLAGCGMALFYPLLTFLSGMVDLVLAEGIAFLLVSALQITFLGLTVGWRRAGWRVGLLLVIFLGLFSLGMLTLWRGLLLSIGGVLLVGVFMLLYARRSLPPEPEPSAEPEQSPGKDPGPLSDDAADAPFLPVAEALHCPFCSRALAEDYGFCPGCGHDVDHIRRCPACGHRQSVSAGQDVVYCMRCGEAIG
jgi:double zinc ribbon protein